MNEQLIKSLDFMSKHSLNGEACMVFHPIHLHNLLKSLDIKLKVNESKKDIERWQYRGSFKYNLIFTVHCYVDPSVG